MIRAYGAYVRTLPVTRSSKRIPTAIRRSADWIARSIAYAVERIGAEHVALGSDWDGAVGVPFDAANVVRLTDALLDVGLDEASIRAVMGENVLRVLAATLPPA